MKDITQVKKPKESKYARKFRLRKEQVIEEETAAPPSAHSSASKGVRLATSEGRIVDKSTEPPTPKCHIDSDDPLPTLRSKNKNSQVHEFVMGASYIGTVAMYDKCKGWGFIASDDVPGNKIFFHWSKLCKKCFPQQGFPRPDVDKIIFTVGMEEHGLGAIQIHLVNLAK